MSDHTRIAWPEVLARLGIPESALRNKHGPCPACGGKDRFRFDNRNGRGDFFCNGCGAGDGFALVMRVRSCDFVTARKLVVEAAGLADGQSTSPDHPYTIQSPGRTAAPTQRVQRLRRGRCDVANCNDAVDYLASRNLWPLPDGCILKAHPSVEYFEDGHSIGRFPALVADVQDVTGELVTLHVTYLANGKKLATHEPRKILSPMTDRRGCAARLMPAGDVLGIAEGVETALAAAKLHSMPVWAALNATLLGRFEPPPNVTRLVVFVDRDEAGLMAAARLAERLQGRVSFEMRVPTAPAQDWCDVINRDEAIA